MGRFNNGTIFTNTNCHGCNKCVNTCVSNGANISIRKNDKNTIEVSNKCISCGVCLDHCSHNARSYSDDTSQFMEALKAGESISLIVSPVFYIIYKEKAFEILGYLKHLGVKKIYDASFGGEISIWLNAKYIRNNQKQGINSQKFLSNTCASFINYCENLAPELIDFLIPVHSPELCTAIYARKYLKDDSKLAFLGSCISSKQEFENFKDTVYINYNVTFLHLLNTINSVETESYHADFDLKPTSIGSLYSVSGGFTDAISKLLPATSLITHYESINKQQNRLLIDAPEMVKNNNQPTLSNVNGCNFGCFSGAGVQRNTIDLNLIYGGAKAIKEQSTASTSFSNDPDSNFKLFEDYFQNLNPEDFYCTFTSRYKQVPSIPETVRNEIFGLLHKDTKAKRHLDCNSCGYPSCTAFVEAVANGYTKIESCIQYMHDEMKYRLNHDLDTGLLNNYSFISELQKLRKKNPNIEFALLSVDIDKLQLINNLYGFETGNTAIRVVSEGLTKLVSDIGICARMGAGNFIMAFPNTIFNLEQVYEMESFDLTEYGVNYPVSVRCGIFILDPKDNDISQAINNATLAMNNITDRVHNAFAIFNQKLYNEVFLESSITAQLKNAVDNDEFQIYFQPQYSHSTKTIVGAETLSRWIKKDGEILSPSSFIPIFEKNGFILDFDHIVWEKTFSAVRKWLDQEIDIVPISVNISRVSMDSDDTIAYISSLQKKYNVPQEYIHLEITESAVMKDQDKLIARISRLKQLGFQIAMDDFGSGYSSLNTLKDFPIDILKLDMGFLRGKENKNRGGNIISSVMRMANMLELATVAEGVETPEQASFLSSLGCDTIQGFLYSRPIPLEQFETLLKSHTKVQIPSTQKLKSLIDVNNFFDTDSMETAIFENFVGPACIAESLNGHLSFVRLNEQFLNLIGYNNKNVDLFKRRFYSYLNRTDAHALRDAIFRAGNNDEEVNLVIEFSPGKKLPSLWLKAHIWRISKNGEQIIFYILIDDITAQIKTARDLEQTNNQLQLIIDNSSVLITLFKIKYGQGLHKLLPNIQFLFVNVSFLEYTGYEKDEVMTWNTKQILKMFHPLDKQIAISKLLDFVNHDKDTINFQARVKIKNGTYKLIRFIINAYKESEKNYTMTVNLIPLD